MTKILNIEINSCADCPYSYFCKIVNKNACRLIGVKNNNTDLIYDLSKIKIKCPLPDKQEAYTIRQHSEN